MTNNLATQLFYCSTLFGALTLAAAIDAGEFGGDARRVLIVSNNGPSPEAHGCVDSAPGFAAVRDRFDAVHSWNDVIAPQHPARWEPLPADVPMLSRYVHLALGLDGPPSALVLESIAVDPARTIALLVPDAPIIIFSDGLMSYGPTRSRPELDVYGRIDRLLYLDLVEGLRPMLLREYGVPSHAVPSAAFRAVLDSVPSTSAPADGPTDAVILGQYLSALGLVTARQEAKLHADMLSALVARGARRVVFKPHPAAGPAHARELRAAADGLDVTLEIAADADPAEIVFRDRRPALVVGCFSTALATAHRLFGIPVATMGTDRVLQRLKPFQNSNRIPATIVHATMPRLGADGGITDPPVVAITALVDAVGHVMQPRAHPELRTTAAAYVAERGEQPYFDHARLVATEVYPPDRSRQAKAHAAVYLGSIRRAEIREEARRRAQLATARARRRWPRLGRRVPPLFAPRDDEPRDPRWPLRPESLRYRSRP